MRRRQIVKMTTREKLALELADRLKVDALLYRPLKTRAGTEAVGRELPTLDGMPGAYVLDFRRCYYQAALDLNLEDMAVAILARPHAAS